MDNDELNRLVVTLEEMADTSAVTRIYTGIPENWLFIDGNRAGLLLLAATCLRAAAAPAAPAGSSPAPESSHQPNPKLSQQSHGEAGRRLIQIAHVATIVPEDAEQEPPPTSLRTRLEQLGCGLVIVLAITLMLGGIRFWWNTLF